MTDISLQERAAEIKSGEPVGKLTIIGNGYAKDELGRVYFTESYEERERKRKYAYKQNDKRHFTFSHMENMREVTKSLPNKYCGYALMLQPYIQYKTNLIATNGRSPEPMGVKQIAKVLDVQPRTAKTAIQKLKEFGVLDETEEGYYKMNERYHFRNKSQGDVDKLVKTFSTTLKKLNLKPADLGVIYKLLPYVHFETNLVCKNPFEVNPKKVEFYNKKELGELIGLSRSKASEVIAELTKAGVIVEIRRKASLIEEAHGDRRETVIALNPSIISRLQGEHGNTMLLQLFNNADY